MKQHELAEAGHAGAVDGLLSAMNGRTVFGNGGLRIDESTVPPKIAWSQNPPIMDENRTKVDRTIQYLSGSFEKLSAVRRDPRLTAYEPRMTFLRNEGENDGLVINWASEFDFSEFVQATPSFRKGNLVLMDNGNLRVTWADQCGNRLALQFLGGRMVQYVIFRKRHGRDAMSRVVGRDSFEGIGRQIDAFDLYELLRE